MTSHFFCYDVTLFCYDVTLFCGTGSTSSDCPSAEEAVAIAGGIIGAIVVCIIVAIVVVVVIIACCASHNNHTRGGTIHPNTGELEILLLQVYACKC